MQNPGPDSGPAEQCRWG